MEILVAVIVIVVLGVIAMYLSMQKKEIDEAPSMPVIHTSGIYSVIRKSPRENVEQAKPSPDALRDFIRSRSTDCNGGPLNDSDRESLLSHFRSRLEQSIKAVEEGDRQGVQRFAIQGEPDCKPCQKFASGRYFITREDVYRHPELLPPYYPGCTCRLVPELEKLFGDDMMHYKFHNSEFPLSDWHNLRKVK